jgi:hypothetical protein
MSHRRMSARDSGKFGFDLYRGKDYHEVPPPEFSIVTLYIVYYEHKKEFLFFSILACLIVLLLWYSYNK